MSGRKVAGAIGLSLALIALVGVSRASAQRGGGGGGGFGGGGFGGGQKARMDALTQAFTLDKDQRKTIKAAIDAGYAGTASARADLAKARAAVVAAVASGKQPDIDAATTAYGTAAAAIASAEMKTLADALGMLNDEQKKNQAAMSTAASLMRNAFSVKKWDDIPDMMEGY
jgi:hypothetical protein